MADETDFDQKTERASAKRLQEARDQGRLPRSRELSIAVTLGSSVIVMMLAGATLSTRAQGGMQSALQPKAAADLQPAQLLQVVGAVTSHAFLIASPLMIASFAAAL